MKPEDRLLEPGLTLPVIDAPSGSYSHGIRDGDLLYLVGKGPANVTDKVSRDFNVQDAY